jgi:hypothetical protein
MGEINKNILDEVSMKLPLLAVLLSLVLMHSAIAQNAKTTAN